MNPITFIKVASANNRSIMFKNQKQKLYTCRTYRSFLDHTPVQELEKIVAIVNRPSLPLPDVQKPIERGLLDPKSLVVHFWKDEGYAPKSIFDRDGVFINQELADTRTIITDRPPRSSSSSSDSSQSDCSSSSRKKRRVKKSATPLRPGEYKPGYSKHKSRERSKFSEKQRYSKEERHHSKQSKRRCSPLRPGEFRSEYYYKNHEENRNKDSSRRKRSSSRSPNRNSTKYRKRSVSCERRRRSPQVEKSSRRYERSHKSTSKDRERRRTRSPARNTDSPHHQSNYPQNMDHIWLPHTGYPRFMPRIYIPGSNHFPRGMMFPRGFVPAIVAPPIPHRRRLPIYNHKDIFKQKVTPSQDANSDELQISEIKPCTK